MKKQIFILNFILFLVLTIAGKSQGASEIYRILEDPRRGPTVLKNWKIMEPISEDKWSGIVGNHLQIPYVVKPGDTLSKISQNLLGSVDYWPKLWEVNKEKISNPHVIEPNQTIIFNVPRDLIRNTASETKENSKKESADLEKTELLRSDIESSHQLRYFFREDEPVLGVITGAYHSNNQFRSGQDVYIGSFDKSKLQVGKSYKIVKEMTDDQLRFLSKRTDFPGKLMQVVGEVKIENYGDDLARAIVLGAYHTLERGDLVMELESLDLQVPAETPPANLVTRIVVGDSLERESFFKGQIVVLDKGSEAGMKPGYLFGVFQDTDPVFKNQKLIEPRSKGEIKVVKVGKTFSIAYVMSNIEPIHLGEPVIPLQQLPSPLDTLGVSRKSSIFD